MYKPDNDVKKLINSMNHLALMYRCIRMPLERHNAIVLEPQTSLANAYIGHFASGKSYPDSEKFSNDCIDGKVLDGLIKNNYLVLITTVRLPMDPSGKINHCNYKKDNADFCECINVANDIRSSRYDLIPTDTPILFYSHNPNQRMQEKIACIKGSIGYIRISSCNHPTYCSLTGKLQHMKAREYFNQKNNFRKAARNFENSLPGHMKDPDISQLMDIFRSV